MLFTTRLFVCIYKHRRKIDDAFLYSYRIIKLEFYYEKFASPMVTFENSINSKLIKRYK
jgi:hypothetical protein